MIRYVLEVPHNLTPQQVENLSEQLKHAATDRQYRDIVISSGGTLKDMRYHLPSKAFIAKARSRAR